MRESVVTTASNSALTEIVSAHNDLCHLQQHFTLLGNVECLLFGA